MNGVSNFSAGAPHAIRWLETYLPLLEEVDEKQVFMPEFDLSNTLTGLNGSDITCHPVNAQLFSTYLEYFTPQGFLEKPRTRAK